MLILRLVLVGCKAKVAPPSSTLPPPASAIPASKGAVPTAASQLNCRGYHGDIHTKWAGSPHADTQADVAGELAEERVGLMPDEVLHDDDAEDCIACHGTTAVVANGGMTETKALGYFFSTVNGKFANDTAATNTADWSHVACIACHDPMNPGIPTYFNSSSQKYELVKSSAELCGQCHGGLRFSGTDHLSYNILSGTGGTGVPDQQTMPGATCTDCHMFVSTVDGSNSAMFHGHSFAITVKEADGKSTTSCTHCHDTIDATRSNDIITASKSDFESLDATAQKNVAAAVESMQGVEDKALQDKLEEAQHNLEYAESDESGGVHNHKYLMSLLNDANDKALEILSALGK